MMVIVITTMHTVLYTGWANALIFPIYFFRNIALQVQNFYGISIFHCDCDLQEVFEKVSTLYISISWLWWSGGSFQYQIPPNNLKATLCHWSLVIMAFQVKAEPSSVRWQFYSINASESNSYNTNQHNSCNSRNWIKHSQLMQLNATNDSLGKPSF